MHIKQPKLPELPLQGVVGYVVGDHRASGTKQYRPKRDSADNGCLAPIEAPCLKGFSCSRGLRVPWRVGAIKFVKTIAARRRRRLQVLHRYTRRRVLESLPGPI